MCPTQFLINLYLAICMAYLSKGSGEHVNVNVTPAKICTNEIRLQNCSLPSCLCSGTDIPGKFQTEENTPQLVYLTFDDAVNFANFPFYEDVLSNRKNPNGHPISATFFVSHEYTNYHMVHELWRKGHEIALHSVTHQWPTEYWKNLSQDMWHKEIVQQREQMANFARIPISDIKGMRAPFLQIGGDRMYNVLKEANFLYDNSRATLEIRKPGLWPYTNDYLSTQECRVAPCPVGSYPGFWTVPLIELIGENGKGCSMADACTPLPSTKKSAFDFLFKNFQDHYSGNKAPFGVFIHSAWVNGTGSSEILERRHGYIQFLDYLASLNDVYIVSISRAIEWIKNPTPTNKLAEFEPFHVETKRSLCTQPLNCRFSPGQTPFETEAERWLTSCVSSCPRIYPWVGHHLGQNK